MNNNRINPVGLKGAEINDRMKELMGITPIVEHKSSPVIELTKIGPDGNIYAVIRENHKYFIKTTGKKENVVSEDFKYIGGLQNKTQEAYPSYAKAIKHLNLKFNSIAESLDVAGNINVFQNDNLIKEDITGFSQYGGNGFSNQGNLEGNTSLYEEEEVEDETAPISEYFGDDEEETIDEDEDELTESEQAIDDMADDADEDNIQEEEVEEEEPINENHLSIKRALLQMDSIIDGLTEVKKKVYTLK